MASNMAKVPLIRSIVTRGLASAAARPAESDIAIDSCTLPNKVQVVNVKTSSPIIRVSVSVKAGSRYETAENLGAAHVLRSSAGLTTDGASTFAITRTIQERASNLYATNDRDTITYTLVCPKEEVEPCLRILGCVTTKQLFKPWELSDNLPRLKYELAQVPPQARVVDMLHGAAYRVGLGNSLFVPKYLLGSQGSETLQHFVQNTFLGNRTAVSSTGDIPSSLIREFAEKLNLPEGPGLTSSSTYYGGELRKRGKGLAHIAIGTEGAGINQKDALAFGILQHALGNGPSVKYASNGLSALAKAVEGAADGTEVGVSALNVSHLDSGLFGVVVSCDPRAAGKIVDVVVKTLKLGSVSDADIKRGKAGLKASILLGAESTLNVTEDLAQQSVLLGAVHTPQALASAVDSLSSSEVMNAARKVASGKLSLAALGDLSCVPYLDQLK